jgi:hypothetical protein
MPWGEGYLSPWYRVLLTIMAVIRFFAMVGRRFMARKVFEKVSLAVSLVALLCIFTPANPALAADPTTSVTITKFDTDHVTILDQTTVTWEWMSENLPVYGDGVTHYYHQGPSFDDTDFDTLWDPDEMVNIDSRDFGTAMGTDIKDLCNLVGGASSGDTIKVKAIDNFSKSFDYEDVYTPESEQGKMILTWYTSGIPDPGGTVPDYTNGMRLVFFAETLNPEGKHVFGNWDMHETLAENRWYYYYDGTYWPSSGGLSVKWVSDIEIYSSGTVENGISENMTTSDSLIATANVILDSVGIALNVDSIDFGDIRPGESSPVKTVIITNTGNMHVDVTLEVQGTNSIAQGFYEQSLYIDGSIYNPETIISSIDAANSDDVDTQLHVPSDWYIAEGHQQATFIFWATASE